MTEEAIEYPRRIKELQETVRKVKNGDNNTTPTAAQSRQLMLQVADIIPDIWDSVIAIKNKQDSMESKEHQKKVDEMFSAYKIGKWIVVLQAGAILLFLINNVLTHVFIP